MKQASTPSVSVPNSYPSRQLCSCPRHSALEERGRRTHVLALGLVDHLLHKAIDLILWRRDSRGRLHGIPHVRRFHIEVGELRSMTADTWWVGDGAYLVLGQC